MSYYSHKRRAVNKIQQMVDAARESKTCLSIPLLTLKITNDFEVGELVVKKRLELLAEIYEDMDLTDKEVDWK